MRRPLGWLLLFAFLHGCWYAIVVHPWQAPDEYLHYEYMRLIDANRSLDLHAEDRSSPIQREIANSMWLFEHYRYRNLPTPKVEDFRKMPTPLGSRVFSQQPPLYYLATLPVYWLVRSWDPLGQLYLLRLFSVLLLVVTVWVTYELTRLVFDDGGPQLATFAAATVALLPQYTFISASYNNDNLAPPMAALCLLFMMRGLRGTRSPCWLVASAGTAALAIASKRTAIVLLPVLGLAVLAYALRWIRSGRNGVRAAGWLALGAISTMVLAMLFVLVRPPTIPTAAARFLRLAPTSLQTLTSQFGPNRVNLGWFARTALDSFWGNFGWLTMPAPAGWLRLWRWMLAPLAVGLGLGIVQAAQQRAGNGERAAVWFAGFVLVGSAAGVATMIAQYMIAPQSYPPQGRYLFPMISGLAVLGAWAWTSLWPTAIRRWALLGGWLLLGAYDLTCWGYVLIPRFYS